MVFKWSGPPIARRPHESRFPRVAAVPAAGRVQSFRCGGRIIVRCGPLHLHLLPLLARKYGVARYSPISGFDFSAGQAYFDATEPFWARVRTAWHALSASGYQLQAAVDQAHLFVPFFRYAQAMADGEEEFDIKTADALIADTLKRDYLVPASEGE